MRDKYKYLELISGRAQWEGFVQDLRTVRTRKLHVICDAFASNVGRTNALSLGFAETAFQMRQQQWCVDYAMYETEGLVRPPFTVFTPSKALSERYLTEINKSLAMPLEERSGLLANWGATSVANLARAEAGMDWSIESLLSSVVIETWTTFEVLASDLWVRAINVGGPVLKERLKSAHKGQWLTPDDNIGVRELCDIDTRKFGSALLDLGRVSFAKLEYIKRFYSLAFAHDFERFFKSVDNGYITALSAIRNVLIHNAGKADKTFKKQVQPF